MLGVNLDTRHFRREKNDILSKLYARICEYY